MPRTLLLVLAALPLAAVESFPHERAGALPPDPAITWGVLPNGLRYALQENHQPAGKAVLRLRIAAGSLNERGDEQGLAHLLEHLAFNGTTHYPPGRLVTDLQHLGLQFGAHTNAHTSFDETVYKLDLPDASTATLTTGLTVLADWGGGMLLPPAEVARERGVVLAEARDRDGWNLRSWKARFGSRYAGTSLPQRFPIGLPEVVGNATPEALRSFYDRWYRPQDMLLVVVADTPVSTVQPLLAPTLAGLTDRSRGAVAPGRGTLTAASAPQVLVHHEAEAEDTTVSWTHIAEAGPMPVDDAAEARRDAARNLLGRVFARRIAALVEADAACPLLRASTDHGRWLDLNHTGVEGRARPGHALDALALLLREARRLRQYGPTAEELAAEAAAMAQDLATAVTRADDRRSRDLAEHLLATTARGEVLRSPAQTRDLYTPILPTLTPADLVAVIKDALEQPGRDVIEVSGREDLGADGAARVQAVVQQVLAEPVAPPAARAAATWAYATDPAAPVGAATLGQDEAHGLVTAQRPGVAVTVKATHFQPGRVAVALRLAVPPCPDAVMVGLIGRAFLAGGLGHHAADDEERLFAGSGINLGASLEDGSFTLAATTTPDRLDRALDRLRAHLVDPGWRLPAYQRARLAWDEELAASERDPSEVADRLLRQHLLGKDPSRRPVVSADLVASTVDANACRAWLAPLLAQAPLAITVVGDVADAAAARDAALRRFPARPTDTPAKATSVEQGRAALLPGVAWRPGRVDTHVPGTVARAALRVAWPTDDQLDIGLSRRRTLLAACLTDRLREDLRQRLGAAYSPGAYHVPSATRRGEGALIALAQVEPAQATLVEERILALADDLATHGIAGDLAQRMLAPVRKALPEVLRRDDWWLGTILARPDQQALRLGWADTIVTDHAAITPGELSALAKQVFVRERTLVVVATCQP